MSKYANFEIFRNKSGAAADACGRPLSDRNLCNVNPRDCKAVRNVFDTTHCILYLEHFNFKPSIVSIFDSWNMSDMQIYPTPTTQYCVVGSSQKNIEKKWATSKTTFKSKIISVFEVGITSLFHATKCDWAKRFSTWRKCCLFVCEKFRTHNVRFRNSFYFETPVMPPLNTIGQNSLKSVFYATLEMPDFELWRFVFSNGFQSKSNFCLHKILEMPDSLWRFDSSQKVNSVSRAWRIANSFSSVFEPNSWIIVSNFLVHKILEMPDFRALKVWFQSKSEFCLESITHCKFIFEWFWTKFLNYR